MNDEHEQTEIRVLILEDTEWDAELAKRLLSSAGIAFEAVVVDTKEAFTAQLASFRPEVIISDYALPGFSGSETSAPDWPTRSTEPRLLGVKVLNREIEA